MKLIIGEVSADYLSSTIGGHWFTTEPRGDRNGVWIDRYGFLEDLHPGEGFIEGVHRLYAEATAEELVSVEDAATALGWSVEDLADRMVRDGLLLRTDN